MEYNNAAQPPPPAYQNSAPKPGETYYQPPNAPDAAGYAPPPPIIHQPVSMGQRFTQFYTPPQNKKLGMRRRICSVICCCIIIGLTVGLAVGLTSQSYYGYSSNCNCRVNSDCTYQYGLGTYCYNGCQCAR